MKLHQLWRIALWRSIFQLSVFLFFWLERVFPSLVIVFWISSWISDQARPWFRFSKRTSSDAGLALCLVAFSRASLVVLFCGENGTAVLSTELWIWALILANWESSQKSEVRTQKWEIGNWKSEVGSRKSEVGSRKWEVESGKWEVRRSSHSALSLSGQRSEIRSSHFVKSEVWSLKYEVWSSKPEVRSRKSEVGSPKSEVGRPSSAFVVIHDSLDSCDLILKHL